MKNRIILIVIFLIILGYSILFYYENRNLLRLEPFCSDCRISPDLGSTKNIGNFINNQQNTLSNVGSTKNVIKSINNDDTHLSHTILSNRCTNVPVGVEDSSYIFCPFTNNCALSLHPGTAYSSNAPAISHPCSVDNSCCDTDFHKNNYYTDDNGRRHPGIVFKVAINSTDSSKSGVTGADTSNPLYNQSDISYSIMSYTPVVKDSGGYYPNMLGSHYHTTITDSADLIIKSNTSDYIDCNGSRMSGFNGRKFPEFHNKTLLFDTPGKIWCLQAENQKYCKANKDKILEPSETSQSSFGNSIKPYNNGFSDPNSLSNNIGTGINTANNPYPSNIEFPSDNKSPLEMMASYLSNVKTKNDKATCNRHKTQYVNTKVFESSCEVAGYNAKPQM
mgnify:FL=1